MQDASTLDSIAAIRVTGVGGARPMFLTPGKLMRMPVPIEVTYTFIGNAKDLGVAIGRCPHLNAPVPGTSANGSFVADFPRRETTLYLLQDDRLLHCPLQVRERRQVVLLVGAVHCEPLAVAQLPRDPPAGPRDPPAAGTRVDRRHAPDRCCRRYAMSRRWMCVDAGVRWCW